MNLLALNQLSLIIFQDSIMMNMDIPKAYLLNQQRIRMLLVGLLHQVVIMGILG